MQQVTEPPVAQQRLAEQRSPEQPSQREQAQGQAATRLDITVRTGVGVGRTPLSAFDNALMGAGVADFNLITLSSVIPPRSRIRTVDATLPGEHGDLLYCVRAEAHANRPGESAWAGLGWCVDESGAGLFVEHCGDTEESLAEQIELSLADMKRTRVGSYGPVQMAVASARYVDRPACAVVVAAYRVETWFPEVAPVEDVRPQPVLEVAPTTTAPSGSEIRVTVEKKIDFATARRYNQLYRETFGELENVAAARQLLDDSEFLVEMINPAVSKYVAWDENGEPIGISTLTNTLDAVPWISPAYFAHRYPDHHARGAIYYMGFTLVRPDRRKTGVMGAMFAQMASVAAAERAVVAWDICRFNDDQGLGGNGGQLLKRLADVTIESIDQQTYYAGEFHGSL